MVWFMTGLAALIVLAGGLALYEERKKFEVNCYEYESEKLKTDEYRFVVMSDLHNMEYGRDNERLIKAVDEARPAAVLFAGDMVESRKNASFHATARFIGTLASRYPIYYGMGNHEHKLKARPDKYGSMYRDFTAAIGKAGVHIMENEIVSIPGAGVKIYGLDLEKRYYRKLVARKVPDGYLEQRLGRVDPDSYSILMAHHPDPFPVYSKWGPDLVLAGHIHGGVIRLPLLGGVLSPQLKLFPKYDGGEFKEGRSTMLLSRGIGNHTLPVRIFNRAEILIVTIKKKRGGKNGHTGQA